MTKPCLYDIAIKLSKLVNTTLKLGLMGTEVVTLLFFLQFLTSKNEKLLFFNFKSEFDFTMLVIHLINKFK